MKRTYMVWLNYYNKDEVYEEWAIKGDFEAALEAAQEVLEAQEELKDIDFWNDDIHRTFVHVNRDGWERYKDRGKDIPEYYYIDEE